MKSISTTGSASHANANVKCTVEAAADLKAVAAIIEQRNWCPALFKDNYRKKENFNEAHYIGLDVDEGCTIERAKQLLDSYGYRYIIQPSKSHGVAKGTKPACDRFRIILELSAPITTENEWLSTIQFLFLSFPFVDIACFDPSRFFFKGGASTIQLAGTTIDVQSGRGKLAAATLKFIQSSTTQYNFNTDLYKVARDFQQQGYEETDLLEVLERHTVQLPGNYGTLSENDLITISRAFDGQPRHEARTARGRPAQRASLDDLIRAAAEILEPHFLHVVADSTTSYYRVTDLVHRTVENLTNEDVITRHVAAAVRSHDTLSARHIPAIIKAWRTYSPTLDEKSMPTAYAWKGSDKYTYHKIDMDLRPGSHPAWDEWLVRVSSPKVFMAWVWSIYEPAHKGRQIMWMYGAQGQDGKSVVMNVLSSLLGNAVGALNNASIKGGGQQFILASLLGKRLVVYPDCKDTHFPQREIVRNLTSNDLCPIERKGQDAFMANLFSRVLVASNYLPKIDSTGADLSRLLVVNIEESKHKGDITWEARLKAELPAFLYACREIYEEMCANHSTIHKDAATERLVNNCHKLFEIKLAILAAELFDFGVDYKCSAIEFTKAAERLSVDSYKEEDLKRYLETNKKVKLTNDENGDIIYPGIKLKGSMYTGKVIPIKKG